MTCPLDAMPPPLMVALLPVTLTFTSVSASPAGAMIPPPLGLVPSVIRRFSRRIGLATCTFSTEPVSFASSVAVGLPFSVRRFGMTKAPMQVPLMRIVEPAGAEFSFDWRLPPAAQFTLNVAAPAPGESARAKATPRTPTIEARTLIERTCCYIAGRSPSRDYHQTRVA